MGTAHLSLFAVAVAAASNVIIFTSAASSGLDIHTSTLVRSRLYPTPNEIDPH